MKSCRICWHVVVLLACLYLQDGHCGCGRVGVNRREPEEAIEFLNDSVKRSFVGQSKALRTVRHYLQDYLENPSIHNGPLLFHFIGPSGTGKSFLAELVAKSLFDDCQDSLSSLHGASNAFKGAARRGVNAAFNVVGSLFSPGFNSYKPMGRFLRRQCDASTALESWKSACGIVYETLTDQSDFEEGDERGVESAMSNARIMDRLLLNAAREISSNPGSVLIVDDANFCRKSCWSKLKELLSGDATIALEDGTRVSTKRSVIILCSDLTEMGLTLNRLDTYEGALERVEQAAEKLWGKDNVLLAKSIHVPFAPLSELEVKRVLEYILEEVEQTLRYRIVKALREKSEKEGKEFHWTGRFVCEEHTLTDIIDRLYDMTEIQNARAITNGFKEMVLRNMALKRVEDKLVLFKKGDSRMYNDQDFTLAVNKQVTGRLQVDFVLLD